MGPSIFTVIKSLSNTSLSEIEAIDCLGCTFFAVCMGPREVGEPKHWKENKGSEEEVYIKFYLGYFLWVLVVFLLLLLF